MAAARGTGRRVGPQLTWQRGLRRRLVHEVFNCAAARSSGGWLLGHGLVSAPAGAAVKVRERALPDGREALRLGALLRLSTRPRKRPGRIAGAEVFASNTGVKLAAEPVTAMHSTLRR